MWYAIAAGVVLLVLLVVLKRRGDMPSVAMFGLIEQGLEDLQAKAMRNILPEQQEGTVTGFDEDAATDDEG